jgi:predicted nucleic acid-binding Zn ribbon protein
MQQGILQQRNCQVCGSPLRGRVDKKFCNDYCRNHYNNGLKQQDRHHPLVRQLNGYLLRNRRILQSLLAPGSSTGRVHRDRLLAEGFLFRYFTHQQLTRKGKIYHYCYEYGYRGLGNGWYMLIKGRETPENLTFRPS